MDKERYILLKLSKDKYIRPQGDRPGACIYIVEINGKPYFNLGDIFWVTYPSRLQETLITFACLPQEGKINLTDSKYIPNLKEKFLPGKMDKPLESITEGNIDSFEIFYTNRRNNTSESYSRGVAKDIWVNAATMFVLLNDAIEREDPDSEFIAEVAEELSEKYSNVDDIYTKSYLTFYPWQLEEQTFTKVKQAYGRE